MYIYRFLYAPKTRPNTCLCRIQTIFSCAVGLRRACPRHQRGGGSLYTLHKGLALLYNRRLWPFKGLVFEWKKIKDPIFAHSHLS